MLSTLEQKVIERIRPTAQEERRRKKVCDSLLSKARKVAIEYNHIGEVVPLIVGSVAKGTHLKGADIDLFLLFPEYVQREVLEKIGLEMGQKLVSNPIIKYAEHPYVRGRAGEFYTDVVPCYSISDPAKRKSAVDRTPFQSIYVNAHIDDARRDQVRLLKQFFKGIGVYGAEARTSGFSGYLTELLILKYGTFREAINSISHWKKGEFISLEGQEQQSWEDAMLQFPDPVDARRNVAAALGSDSFSLAIIASREYIRSPSLNFFFPRERKAVSLQKLKKYFRNTNIGLIMFTISKPDIVEDNLYPQIAKARKNIQACLEKYDFNVERSIYKAEDEISILFLLRHRSHPRIWVREGPAGWSENSCDFIAKHREKGGSLFINEGKLYSIEEKQNALPAQTLLAALGTLSLGADIDRLKHTVRIEANEDVLVEKNKKILSELLFPSFPWEL
jgi:tRNA nucleotidyltransferase (CCA-adding enzyme)